MHTRDASIMVQPSSVHPGGLQVDLAASDAVAIVNALREDGFGFADWGDGAVILRLVHLLVIGLRGVSAPISEPEALAPDEPVIGSWLTGLIRRSGDQ